MVASTAYIYYPQRVLFFTFGGGLSLGAALGLISLFAPISECTSSEALKVVEKIGVCLDRLPRQTPSSSILTKH